MLRRRLEMLVKLIFALLFVCTLSIGTCASDFTARGSDSTLGLMKALADAYKASSGINVNLEGGGSGKGIKAVQNSEVALAFSSRELKEAEISAGLVGTPYALDGLAIIVNKENPVTSLKIAELADFFSGRNATWSDGKAVALLDRNADSGTRELFVQNVMKDAKVSDKAMIKHDGVLQGTIAKLAGAIGYTSFCDVHESVKVVAVESVVPSNETISNKTYPLVRVLTLVTKGAPTSDVKNFVDFVGSDKGKAIITEHKYLPLGSK